MIICRGTNDTDGRTDGQTDNYLPHYSGISSHSKELVQWKTFFSKYKVDRIEQIWCYYVLLK
jgi:hypothetical protein